MPLSDLPLNELQTYRPGREEPPDFDAFWQRTLAEARRHPLGARFEPVDYGLRTLESFDVTFSGFGGQPVKGWFLLPANYTGRLACVVEYIGYGGGRGFPTDWLFWPSLGYAYLVMDTRGQGSVWRTGDTPDPAGADPQAPGFMTRGVLSPDTYYYRRLMTDAVRAVEAALSHPAVDGARLAVTGGSQGGGLSLAVSGLEPRVAALLADVPFLCHYRRAVELAGKEPYLELVRYLKIHRDQVAQVFTTLAYFDGLNFAARAQAPALFSVALMDEVCPPSTVFAAYHHYQGEKQMRVWPFNEHEGGQSFQDREKARFLAGLWGSGSA